MLDQAEFVNVIDGDMPGDMAGDNENCNGLDELIDGSADVIQPTMKPYHSGSGYVPVDRRFFQCDMFTTREKDDVFYMIDLLQMAQFVIVVSNLSFARSGTPPKEVNHCALIAQTGPHTIQLPPLSDGKNITTLFYHSFLLQFFE